MVRPLGLEPRTCGLRVRCSAVELEARRTRLYRPGDGLLPDVDLAALKVVPIDGASF